jgi:hypothetical protein
MGRRWLWDVDFMLERRYFSINMMFCTLGSTKTTKKYKNVRARMPKTNIKIIKFCALTRAERAKRSVFNRVLYRTLSMHGKGEGRAPKRR